MTTKLYPTIIGNVIELSNKAEDGSTIFRKQILPVGKFNYRGSTLDLSVPHLKEMERAFKEKAYDQVPFQLANGRNEHTETKDPRYTEGELLNTHVDERYGLVGEFKLSEEGAALVRKNPKLGVSAKINVGRENAKGERWPLAIEHVLGTVNPHLTGMSPWEEVTLSAGNVESDSNEDTEDISGVYYESPDTLEPVTDEEDEDNAMGDTQTTDESVEGQDEELGQLLDKVADEPDGEDDKDVRLSNTEQQVYELTSQLNQERWGREADAFVAAGVPPHMVELARPVMTAVGQTSIELSGGDKVEPAEVIRSILKEAQGTVELSTEIGHQVGGSESAEDAEFLKMALDEQGD